MTQSYFLLERAEGSIQAGEDQQERLDEVTQKLASGVFHVQTDGRIPYGCKDGRDTRDGISPKPDSAGGSETLFVADDLTTRRFATDGTTVGAYAKTLEFISSAGYEVGGHTDEIASGEGSGCGANDQLPRIYDFIARNSEYLRDLAAKLGVTTSDELFERIIQHAKERTNFSSGRQLLDVLRTYGDEKADLLTGEHKEVAAVINMRFGTTLDRIALKEEFGELYESFNVDAWTFNESAELISETPPEKEAKILAMILYNLGTAHILGGPKLRIIVLN